MSSTGSLSTLCQELLRGHIDRRAFIHRVSALGLGAGLATFMANAVAVQAAGGSRNGFAVYPGQDGTPAGTPVDASLDIRPAVGMEGKTRGQDGDLRILQWQAVSHLCRHKSTGVKDNLVTDFINEPLMRTMPDGSLIPNLVLEVPSVENGLLKDDLTEVTFNLRPDVVWSDGEPFTGNDVRFTWEWVLHPDTGATTLDYWQDIADIEVVDDHTIRVSFVAPNPAWFDPFSADRGAIYPAHFWGGDITDTAKNDEFMMSPIGTGPFVVEEFTPNDQAVFVANERYREPDKPAFARVIVKGGGDPAAAARAVLQTGEYDYAWNLQVEPEVLDSLVSDDSPGEVVVERGTAVERLNFQFADPWTEVDGQRAEMNTPHPILTDKAVRQAISFAIPRDLIAERFYGEGQPATPNILTGLESFDSPNTSWEYDLEKASRILDDAGWIMEGNVRKKDDLELRLVLATSVNSVRQKTQAVIKEELSKIGIEVQLEQVDAAIYFDSAAGNDQNIGHFYWDMNMWATNAQSVIPIGYMNAWYAGADRQNIAQKSNEWSGNNQARWVNEEYDATYDSIFTVTSMEEALELLIRLNDIVIEDVAVLPLVNRSADTYGISRTLVKENVALGAGMERNYWNIANWNRKAE